MVGVDSGPSLTSNQIKSNHQILEIHLNPTEGSTQLIQENAYIFERFTCSLALSKPGSSFALTQKKSPATQAALPSPHSVSFREYGLESQSPYFKDFLLLSAPARALGMWR